MAEELPVPPGAISSEPCKPHDEKECEELEFVADVVLFTFFMLLIGLLTKNLLRKVPVPYTGMLLIFGLLLGFLHGELRPERRPGCRSRLVGEGEEDTVWQRGYRELGRGIEAWTSIEPELLLLIHLPALIFASAFTLDFHIVKRNFLQILILAGPGVGVGTVLTAVVGKYVFPYNWCWPKALLFGSMLAATDPVAVVALLKEVGASAILGTVIEGESLFNDGTAFVFFLVFRDLIRWTTSCNSGECNGAQHINCNLCACDAPVEHESEAHEEEHDSGRRLLSSEEGDGPVFTCPDFTALHNTPNRNVGESIEFFLRMALGGPVVGMTFGAIASYWINFVFNDMVVEVAITFVTTYLCYYTAEDIFGMSGVLSIVGLGLFMAVFARPRLSPKAHEPMEVFWEMVEYFANTMIFVYSGVKIAIVIWENAVEADEYKETFIHSDEWGYAILLYVLLQFLRLLTILLCYPFLMLTGYKIHWKDVIVMVWGGLRGAVGLALSLIVYLDEDRLDPKFRALIIFFMGMMAAMTLIVNGATMPLLLSALGVTTPKPEQLEVLLHVVKELEEIGDISDEEPDELLGDPDKELVGKLTELKTEKVIPSDRQVCEVMRDAVVHNSPAALGLEEHLSHNLDVETPPKESNTLLAATGKVLRSRSRKSGIRSRSCQLPEEISGLMLVKDFRARMLTGVKSAYGEMNEMGELNADQHFYLKESADDALDDVSQPLNDWQRLENELSFRRYRHFMNLASKIRSKEEKLLVKGGPVEKFSDQLFFYRLEKSIVMAVAFYYAHEEASDRLQEYIEYVKKQQETNEAEAGAAKIVEEASSVVLQESKEESEKAIDFLKNMRHAYPEIIRAIKSKRTAWEVLQNKSEYVERVGKSGLVEQKEAQALMILIQQKMKKLFYQPPKANLPESKSLLRKHHLFADLPASTFESEVWPHAALKVFGMGQSIFEIGQAADYLSLVVRGIVKLEFPGSQKTHHHEGTGTLIGVSEVLLNERRSRSLVAETVTEVYQIDAAHFRELAKKHLVVRRRAWQKAATFMTVLHPWGVCKGKTHSELRSIFRMSELVELEKGEEYHLTHIGYLVSGTVVDNKAVPKKAPIKAPFPLSFGPTYLCLSDDAKILLLPEVLGELRAAPRLGRVSRPGRFNSRSISIAVLQSAAPKRVSIARLSQRPSALTRATAGRGAKIAPGGSMPQSTFHHALNEIPEAKTVKVDRRDDEVNEPDDVDDDRNALLKTDSEPQWRLEQAVQSADQQLRQEAARITRASTGVTPVRKTYRDV